MSRSRSMFNSFRYFLLCVAVSPRYVLFRKCPLRPREKFVRCDIYICYYFSTESIVNAKWSWQQTSETPHLRCLPTNCAGIAHQKYKINEHEFCFFFKLRRKIKGTTNGKPVPIDRSMIPSCPLPHCWFCDESYLEIRIVQARRNEVIIILLWLKLNCLHLRLNE